MKIFSEPIIKDRHRSLLLLIKDQWLRLFLSMICMLVIAGARSAIPFLIKPVVDDIFINKDIGMLKLIPLAVITIYLVLGFAMYWQEYLMNYVGQNIIRRLRNRLYDRIQDLPLSFFHREKTGVLISRVTNDVNIIKNMVSSAVTGSLKDFFTVIGLIFVIFYRDWKMALIALVVLPFAFFPIIMLGRKVRKVTTRTQEAMGGLTSILHETFAGNKIVKAFGMEGHEKERFFRKTLKLFKFELKTVRLKALSSPLMEFLGGMGIAMVIWYGGYKVISGTSTAGTFFSFMAALIMLYAPLKKLSKLNNIIQQGLAGADRVFDILESESDIQEIPNPVKFKRGAHHVIFRNVYFKYDDEMVLKNINLDVGAGEILAFVGMSGGGKTSLVNLIPRFYDVSKGVILIDDIDIRDASISSLRDQIAIVTQEPILFNDTVRNNIAYGNKNASDRDIENAARAAYAYEFIQNFPDGFDTNIGELGGRLSGGEKQRTCIARALLKDAPILILDEATSSLDAESETLVQKALENLMKGRTTFVIAHRLSTVAYADRIVVIVDGRIVEEGQHEELIARGGEYFKLYQMQFNDSSSKKAPVEFTVRKHAGKPFSI
ncbi:MAG: ABC transporter ATP-binding protein [Deltaproteobacteria bacterium]|nr:ABC transporter ATP-binding protein [Deltaproteobacteria bacterium]MBW2320184.1 ABC transporter ATP-binding protein [Deltaproteobacteria bacterium]